MRPLTIDLDALSRALDSPDQLHYLDLLSGRIEPFDEALELQLLEEPDRYLAIEPWEPEIGYRLMQEFTQQVIHPLAYPQLQQALTGRRAARAFRHVLGSFPQLGAEWQSFERERHRELAEDWLEEQYLRAAAEPSLRKPPAAPVW
ncbi:hypothetical protein JQX08_10375 [Pseudomonas sp. UL073]|uniref:Uncharacterized protein n=1 Tax=Zestomonas insulae TaxID=2809017 RepID=A0ABS2IDC7_9GAMM|nr:UPF0158 family protein [Pseudomonas insulae]MBM7061111.1 hypothetical protein [Pseudomonas insulae]